MIAAIGSMPFAYYHTANLAPSSIRFTQDSIGKYFQDGNLVNDLIEDIAAGRVRVGDIPMIKVAKKNNRYYSSDNRRLYVFRVLQKRGLIQTIKVRLVKEIYDQKMTTNNDGNSVKVRYDRTLPHTFHEVDYGWSPTYVPVTTRRPATSRNANHVPNVRRECTTNNWQSAQQQQPAERNEGGVLGAVIVGLFLLFVAFLQSISRRV